VGEHLTGGSPIELDPRDDAALGELGLTQPITLPPREERS